jgi:hypothetical protein
MRGGAGHGMDPKIFTPEIKISPLRHGKLPYITSRHAKLPCITSGIDCE